MPKKKPASPKTFPGEFRKEMMLLAEHSRSQIIVTGGYLELFVTSMAKAKCKHGKRIAEDSRQYTQAVKLVLLHELGIIDDIWFDLLNAFRGLRNAAAHEATFELTEDDLLPFQGFIAGDLDIAKLENFGDFCTQLLYGFWNKHSEILTPLFGGAGPGSRKMLFPRRKSGKIGLVSVTINPPEDMPPPVWRPSL